MTCILGRCNGQVNAQVGRLSEPTGSAHSRAHEHKSRIDRCFGEVCVTALNLRIHLGEVSALR
jgi:hypothetical protein